MVLGQDVRLNRTERAFELLKNLFDEKADINVPNDLVISNFKLGAWLSRRRQEYAKGKLSSNQICRLEARYYLGPRERRTANTAV